MFTVEVVECRLVSYITAVDFIMTHTALKITCVFCENRFNGVAHQLINITKEYEVTCPQCGKLNVISGLCGFVDAAPSDAVEVVCREAQVYE